MQSTDEKGFTLVEIIMVTVIIAIMTAFAVPSFLSWLPNMRLKAAARDLYGAAMKTKGEAVKRNVNCALTFNQPIGATTYAYIVFADADSDCEYDGGETVLLRVEQWPKDVLLDTTQGGGDGISFPDNDDGNPTVVFRPTAIPTANGGGFVNGSAFLINTKGRTQSVVVSQAGNISIN